MEKAADEGVLSDSNKSAACGHLAELVTENDVGPRIQQRAAELLAEECNGAEEHSCFYLGRLCSEGWGVPPDQARALRLLSQACDGGVADAGWFAHDWSLPR